MSADSAGRIQLKNDRANVCDPVARVEAPDVSAAPAEIRDVRVGQVFEIDPCPPWPPTVLWRSQENS
jgi:hypothetical protein